MGDDGQHPRPRAAQQHRAGANEARLDFTADLEYEGHIDIPDDYWPTIVDMSDRDDPPRQESVDYDLPLSCVPVPNVQAAVSSDSHAVFAASLREEATWCAEISRVYAAYGILGS